MELIETDQDTYYSVINNPYHIFNSVEFNVLNKEKCEKVFFLLFKEKKYRLGLIAGASNGALSSHFSAPFGSFSFTKGEEQIKDIENAVDELERFAQDKGLREINHILPPVFYNKNFLPKLINVFHRKQYDVSNIDLDYYFILDNFDEDYASTLRRNARKNLAIGLNSELSIRTCEDRKDKKNAYDIIKTNREEKGFPLKMSFDDLEATSEVIESDYFIVSLGNEDMASAIVFKVAPRIMQIIYWGDISGYSEYKPINFLSYKLFGHYKGRSMKIVDIGPSTENSIPNYGLGEFKESIGCDLSPKFSFRKQI